LSERIIIGDLEAVYHFLVVLLVLPKTAFLDAVVAPIRLEVLAPLSKLSVKAIALIEPPPTFPPTAGVYRVISVSEGSFL